MKMLMMTYSGADPGRITTLLDQAGVPGHTCFAGGHGQGLTGPRTGTRAWPGEVTVCFAVVEDELARSSSTCCRALELPPGERLHVAVLSVESFF